MLVSILELKITQELFSDCQIIIMTHFSNHAQILKE